MRTGAGEKLPNPYPPSKGGGVFPAREGVLHLKGGSTPPFIYFLSPPSDLIDSSKLYYPSVPSHKVRKKSHTSPSKGASSSSSPLSFTKIPPF